MMPFSRPRRKSRTPNDHRGRPRRASLTQQTRKTRWDSYRRSARHQEPSGSGWSSDSRRSSDESFKCAGDQAMDCFQLMPAPKRRPKPPEPKAQQQPPHNSSSSHPTPAEGELKRAADGGDVIPARASTSTIEKIRFMQVVAEVDKAVGMAPASSASSSSSSDHHTYRQPGPIAKDGQQAGSMESGSLFSSPTPYSNPIQLESHAQEGGRPGELRFNVDIFKSSPSGEILTIRPPETSKSNLHSSDGLVQEELHAERWESLQQLERRATEASLEGLRKASLKSISSGSHETHRSAQPFSRQTFGGGSRSKRSSRTSRRWGSNESHRTVEHSTAATGTTTAIPLSGDPFVQPDENQTSRKEMLLLRSPSVSVVQPILEKMQSSAAPAEGTASDAVVSGGGLGAGRMSRVLNLSKCSEVSGRTDETDVLMPLQTTRAGCSKTDEQQSRDVIALPSSAVRQMVRTSNYLINRKNSATYSTDPIDPSLVNWNYQDDLNRSNDDVTQPSLIEISMNKVKGESIGEDMEGGMEVLGERVGWGEGEGWSGTGEPSRFRRLSIGDAGTAPRDRRYRYQKTHPALPPNGPSATSSLPQRAFANRPAPATLPPRRSSSLSKPPPPLSLPSSSLPHPLTFPPAGHGGGSGAEAGGGVAGEKGWTPGAQAWSACGKTTRESWSDFRSQGWGEEGGRKVREVGWGGSHQGSCERGARIKDPGRRGGRRRSAARGAQPDCPGKRLYRLPGPSSQSEPALPSNPRHPSLSTASLRHRLPRKLRKRGLPPPPFPAHHPVPPPPLPPLSSHFSTPASTKPFSKSFLASLKLFCKTFLAPHPSPSPLHHNLPPFSPTTTPEHSDKSKPKVPPHHHQ